MSAGLRCVAAISGGGEPARPADVDAGTWRRMSRPARLAAVVAAPLLTPEQLGLAWEGYPDAPVDPAGRRAGIALVWATAIGEFSSSLTFLRSLHARGAAGASPLAFQTAVHSAAAGQLSIAFGLRGPSDTLCATDTLSGDALLVASLRAVDQPVLLVAADELGPDVATGLALVGRAGREEAVALLLGGAGVPLHLLDTGDPLPPGPPFLSPLLAVVAAVERGEGRVSLDARAAVRVGR